MFFDISWHRIKEYLFILKEAFQIYKENHPVKFASAIAYFSLFALPSMFLIIVYFLSFIFSRTEILRELREQLAAVVGVEGADILVVITENYEEQASENTFTVIIYVIIVFWLSTQLFRLFQNSLNDLWRIKPDFSSFWRRIWVDRILTFFLVLITGLMFYASLIIERALKLPLIYFQEIRILV
ncbi:hypothetical protein BH23BAC1_BH23BAC1_28010 [soil metagenome]